MASIVVKYRHNRGSERRVFRKVILKVKLQLLLKIREARQ